LKTSRIKPKAGKLHFLGSWAAPQATEAMMACGRMTDLRYGLVYTRDIKAWQALTEGERCTRCDRYIKSMGTDTGRL